MPFTPGKTITTYTLKNGKKAVIRYPKWEDWKDLWEYINELSAEDTYITFSGERISKEKEMAWIGGRLKDIEMGDVVVLLVFVEEKMAGIIEISRFKGARTRQRHIGGLYITVRKEFRGQGLGRVLLREGIKQARKNIKGLKMIVLDVFSINTPAIRLYESEGFVEYGRLKKGIFYRRRYVDEIKMVLYLR